MKINLIGIVSAILASISLVLPWWTLSFSSPTPRVETYNYFLWSIISNTGELAIIVFNYWWTYIPLFLIIFSTILGAMGSIKMTDKKGKNFLFISGLLAIISAIIFIIGLSSLLREEPVLWELKNGGEYYASIFTNEIVQGLQISSYLHAGFYLLIASAILSLAFSLFSNLKKRWSNKFEKMEKRIRALEERG